MSGKNILITGATSGIGECIARYLHSQGMTVFLVGRNESKLELLRDSLKTNVFIFRYDLCDLENIHIIFEYAKEQGIVFDGFVHSAGIAEPMPIKINNIDSMERTMKTNCMSFLEMGKIFCNKKYSNNEASIVAISSLAAVRPVMGQAVYAASKAGLNAVVEVMSKEYIKRKIRVNSIMPSYVSTPMVNGDVSYGMNNGIENMPLGVIEPLQIAYLVEFLLSEKSKYITGTEIPVTAGV